MRQKVREEVEEVIGSEADSPFYGSLKTGATFPREENFTNPAASA